jgi:hypothetical protein
MIEFIIGFTLFWILYLVFRLYRYVLSDRAVHDLWKRDVVWSEEHGKFVRKKEEG